MMKLSYTIRNWQNRGRRQVSCMSQQAARWSQAKWSSTPTSFFVSPIGPLLSSRATTPAFFAPAARRQLAGQDLAVPCVGVEADLMDRYAEQEFSAALDDNIGRDAVAGV